MTAAAMTASSITTYSAMPTTMATIACTTLQEGDEEKGRDRREQEDERTHEPGDDVDQQDEEHRRPKPHARAVCRAERGGPALQIQAAHRPHQRGGRERRAEHGDREIQDAEQRMRRRCVQQARNRLGVGRLLATRERIQDEGQHALATRSSIISQHGDGNRKRHPNQSKWDEIPDAQRNGPVEHLADAEGTQRGAHARWFERAAANTLAHGARFGTRRDARRHLALSRQEPARRGARGGLRRRRRSRGRPPSQSARAGRRPRSPRQGLARQGGPALAPVRRRFRGRPRRGEPRHRRGAQRTRAELRRFAGFRAVRRVAGRTQRHARPRARAATLSAQPVRARHGNGAARGGARRCDDRGGQRAVAGGRRDRSLRRDDVRPRDGSVGSRRAAHARAASRQHDGRLLHGGCRRGGERGGAVFLAAPTAGGGPPAPSPA